MNAPTRRALVVHESMFGNTDAIAHAVARGLTEEGFEVTSVGVDGPPRGEALEHDLVVLGAPTHAFSLSRPSTRADAVRQGGAADAEATGLREWLDDLPRATGDRVRVAVFDTRASKVSRLPMAAGPRAAKLLRRKGYRLLGQSKAFLVSDIAGPLVEGEEERATAWARSLAAELGATAPAGGAT